VTQTAVVSGLGPNGMLATLQLLASGAEVTAVEQRTTYARAIHLSLRRSYFDDVRAIDSQLCAKLEAIASPIEEAQWLVARRGTMTRVVERPSAAVPSSLDVAGRLRQTPSVHVRLDELERVFFDHLAQLSDTTPLTLLRGHQLTLLRSDDNDRYSAVCTARTRGDVVFVDAPDLVVIAEGGKSPTAAALGKRSRKLSAPRLYISVHVDVPLGPITRRLDTQVEIPGGGHVDVCFWATGHRDPSKGTWLVLEVPALLHAGKASHTFDRDYFDNASMRLLDLSAPPTLTTHGLMGTFRFEQQLLIDPTAGENVVIFGDAAGMGHHSLGTGLEVGACDLSPLRRAIETSTTTEYAKAVVASRICLLAFGMREYYADIDVDPTPWLRQALEASTANPDVEPRDLVESWVKSRR